jgi:hypothetical protein
MVRHLTLNQVCHGKSILCHPMAQRLYHYMAAATIHDCLPHRRWFSSFRDDTWRLFSSFPDQNLQSEMIPSTHVSINMCMLIFLSRMTPTATLWFLKKKTVVANDSRATPWTLPRARRSRENMLRSMELDEKLCNLRRLAAAVAAANYRHREQNHWQEAALDSTCDSGVGVPRRSLLPPTTRRQVSSDCEGILVQNFRAP